MGSDMRGTARVKSCPLNAKVESKLERGGGFFQETVEKLDRSRLRLSRSMRNYNENYLDSIVKATQGA